MQHWLRKVRVTFSGEGGSLEVNPGNDTGDQIFVSFYIEKTISGSANTANVEIYNLSESSRNALGSEFTNIQVEAGYQGNIGIIFSGQIRDVEHSRFGTDIVSTVTCGDGDKATRKAIINKTFPTGTTVEEMVEENYAKLAEQGIDRGEWVFPKNLDAYLRPYSVSSGVLRELNTLGRSHGFYWSIQNNTLEIIPSDEWLPGGLEIISKDTGMIGLPRLTDNGVKVTSLINPAVRPKRLIQVISDAVELNAENGEYRVGNIDYEGDNRDGDFLMIIHAEAKKGGVIDEGKK